MHASFLDAIVNYIQGDGLTVLPEMELLLFALGILLFDFLLEKKDKRLHGWLALLGVAASGSGVFLQAKRFNLVHELHGGVPGLFGFQDAVIVDGLALVFAAIVLAATGVVILLSFEYLDIEREQEGEYYALLLLACIGMMFMASGNDLTVMFLGLETMALCGYVLAGFLRREKRSNEAALKYLLLGGFSSAILAYGFSLLYGLTGSTSLREIGGTLDARFQIVASKGMADWLVILAFVTVAAGLFLKIGAVPFHQWAPDVTEGAPTPISAYVSAASRVASFGLLLRLFIWVFGGSQGMWQYLVAGVAMASLAWGNLAALTQNNLKRLLAYASISHVGFILLGLVGGGDNGFTGIVFYLIAYAFMTIGAFAVIVVLRQRELIGEELEDLNGLHQRSPAAALLLLIFMLSLAGIPATAGFMGKYFIFLSLMESHHPVMAIFAALSIVPGLYYYLRVVAHAWMKKPGEGAVPEMSSAQAVALGVAVFVTLAAGLYPEPFLRLARYAFGS
jgi:NADH-quinone oxidoreductase subunit N